MSKVQEAADTLRVKSEQWREAQRVRADLFQRHKEAVRVADALSEEVIAAEEALKAAALAG